MLRQRKATKVSPGSSPTTPHMLEQVMNERKGAKALSLNAMGAIPPCNHCGELESPQWRKGPSACCNHPCSSRRVHTCQCTSDCLFAFSRLTILPCGWLVAAGDKPHLCNACGTRYLRKGSLNHSANRRNSMHKVQHKAVAQATALTA
jgi:hypothetical protein